MAYSQEITGFLPRMVASFRKLVCPRSQNGLKLQASVSLPKAVQALIERSRLRKKGLKTQGEGEISSGEINIINQPGNLSIWSRMCTQQTVGALWQSQNLLIKKEEPAGSDPESN